MSRYGFTKIWCVGVTELLKKPQILKVTQNDGMYVKTEKLIQFVNEKQ